jgi:hypothetical protein
MEAQWSGTSLNFAASIGLPRIRYSRHALNLVTESWKTLIAPSSILSISQSIDKTIDLIKVFTYMRS